MKKTFLLLCVTALIGTAAFAQEADAQEADAQDVEAQDTVTVSSSTSTTTSSSTTSSDIAAESDTAAKPAKAPREPGGLLSIGGGYVYGYGWNRPAFAGKVQGGKIYTVDETDINANGIALFFDATYGQFAVDLLFPATTTAHNTYHMDTGKNAETIKETALALKFELLGKYPLAIGPFSLFPLLGVNYTLDFGNLDNSKLGFAGGAGLDIPLSIFSNTSAALSKLYIRVEALYGLQLKSPAQQDAETAWTDQESIPGYSDLKADAGFTHGVQVKLGVGYKF